MPHLILNPSFSCKKDNRQQSPEYCLLNKANDTLFAFIRLYYFIRWCIQLCLNILWGWYLSYSPAVSKIPAAPLFAHPQTSNSLPLIQPNTAKLTHFLAALPLPVSLCQSVCPSPSTPSVTFVSWRRGLYEDYFVALGLSMYMFHVALRSLKHYIQVLLS